MNSMLIGEILINVTGKTAKTLINERIFSNIGLNNYTAWKIALETLLPIVA